MKKVNTVKIIIAAFMTAVMLTGCVPRIPDIDFTEPEANELIEYTLKSEASDENADAGAQDEAASESESGRLFIVSDTKPAQELVSAVSLGAGILSDAGFKTKVVSGKIEKAKQGDIILTPAQGLTEEGYSLEISGGRVKIGYSHSDSSEKSRHYNGVIYGICGAVGLLMKNGGTFPDGFTSTEVPQTSERVLMIDCARKYWSPEWMKNLIKQMMWMGYNTLELHMTEEQGIRFNIWEDAQGKKYPDANGNDFSFICGGTKVSWNSEYAEKTGVFYDRDEIFDIISCAREHHIEIIPSVDLPGHSYNLIKRCEEKLNDGGLSFNYNGKKYSENGASGIVASGSSRQTVDISSEFARNLTFAVTDAYAAFFKELGCTKFNIGADEVTVDDSGWSNYAQKNGGRTQHDAFIIYINSLCALLKEKGYSVRAFNDHLFGDDITVKLDPELEICWWSGEGGTSVKAAAGRKVYNCIENNCYYPLRQSKDGTDARSESCDYWSFNHSSAKRIYSGCGDAGCPGENGWDPTKLWSGSISAPAGAYFLIWGDWAKWDTELNMVTRDDSFNLIGRMWANIAKMKNHKAASEQSFEEFTASTEPVRISPECPDWE